jgi:hypothetical protein
VNACDPNAPGAPADCNDEQLIVGLKHALARQSSMTARLIAFMAEVDARGLYRGFAYASMFEYAVYALHMSEGEAFPRIYAGRVIRKYPAVLRMLERGELHLAVIRLVGPQLTPGGTALRRSARYPACSCIEQRPAAPGGWKAYDRAPQVRVHGKPPSSCPSANPRARCE